MVLNKRRFTRFLKKAPSGAFFGKCAESAAFCISSAEIGLLQTHALEQNVFKSINQDNNGIIDNIGKVHYNLQLSENGLLLYRKLLRQFKRYVIHIDTKKDFFYLVDQINNIQTYRK